MNLMQRRDFLRTALSGAGAAGALALPVVQAARLSDAPPRLHALLARADAVGDRLRWLPLDQCRSEACTATERSRISIDRLQFPAGYGAVAVDAMFATAHGILPFRMASYQPDSLSPISQPFAFEAYASGLAGFQAEHARPGDDAARTVASAALLGSARPALTDGRYLLLLSRDTERADLAAVAVSAQATDSIVAVDGSELPFACIAFSVQRRA